MIEYVMWIISFFTLYISIVWLNFLYLTDFTRKKKRYIYFPGLTVAVPAYNEENSICENLNSLVECDYPKDKLRIVVVNDGSADGTERLVRDFIAKHPGLDIRLINQKNRGKAGAVNTALAACTTELFACLDADSLIERDAVLPMVQHFSGGHDVAAVISAIKVYNPRNIYEKMQRFEYLMAVLMRKIRSAINTLAMTPGVLSIYRTSVLKDVGGFDENNMTEDFEIAMRLRYHGYRIVLEENSVTYTKVPDNFRMLWQQRLRWFRGYLYNHYKYRCMFFSGKYNRLFSCFQLPLNIFSIFMLLFIIIFVSANSVAFFFERIIRITTIKSYLPSLFYIPTLKGFILSHNFKVMFPIYIGSVSGFFLFFVAHRIMKEKFRHPFAIWAYFIVFPYISFTHWIFSISDELMRRKRKW